MHNFRQQQMKAKQIMGTLLKANMEVLQRLASSAPHATLIRERCAEKVAAVGVALLEELCGARAVDNKVQNPAQYGFKPRELLGQLVQVMLCCCVTDDASAATEAGARGAGVTTPRAFPQGKGTPCPWDSLPLSPLSCSCSSPAAAIGRLPY